MMNIKINAQTIFFYIASLTLFLFLGVPTLHAADVRFCDEYARKAIQQQVANVAHECGGKDLRWSPLYQGQKDWCLAVRRPIAKNETRAREEALTRCGVTSERIRWRGLKGAPSVWDALFAEEMKAIRQDDAISLQVMHEHGVDLNHDEGFNNGTILFHAIKHQAEQSVRYLVRQGVNPNRTTNGGWNPMVNLFTRWDEQQKKYVDTKVNLALLQFLLNNGSDPNSYGELGVSDLPLDKAVQQNDSRAATLLLSAGADPNKFDPMSKPLLMRTLISGRLEMATLLVNWGAKVNVNAFASCRKPIAGTQLPLDQAQTLGLDAMVRLLRNRGAKTMAECLGAG